MDIFGEHQSAYHIVIQVLLIVLTCKIKLKRHLEKLGMYGRKKLPLKRKRQEISTLNFTEINNT